MSRLYKSASGKMVDLEQLALQNEESIAVGNMRVNARGDELGPGGKVVKTKNQRVADSYNLHSMVPKDEPVPDTRVSNTVRQRVPTPETNATQVKPSKQAEPTQKLETQTGSPAKRQRGGLAASIAKTKVVSSDKTASQTSIKRIQNGGQ